MLAVGGRVAGGEQQVVAVAQRDLELLGEVDDHLAAGLRAAGLDEAQVTSGHAGLQGEIELAEAPAAAPVLQQRPERDGIGDRGHRGGP